MLREQVYEPSFLPESGHARIEKVQVSIRLLNLISYEGMAARGASVFQKAFVVVIKILRRCLMFKGTLGRSRGYMLITMILESLKYTNLRGRHIAVEGLDRID